MSAEFSSTVETINPAIAEQYLARNLKNRPLKNRAIAKYSRDMAAGRWGLTGEALKFDKNGSLIDGQNRLHAVIDSGATIKTVVQRGLDPEMQGIMDSSVPRSGADQLTLHGYPDGKNLQAVCNAHRAYHSGALKHVMTGLNSTERMTNSEIVPYVTANPGLVDATTEAKRIRTSLMLTVGSLAVAYDKLVRIDPDAADDFFSRIKDMRTTGKGDPIATLIKRVSYERLNGRRLEVGLGLFLVFRAWNAYRDGEPLSKFQLGSSTSGWGEIPEPK